MTPILGRGIPRTATGANTWQSARFRFRREYTYRSPHCARRHYTFHHGNDSRDAAGLEKGLREFAEAAGVRLMIYLKEETNMGGDLMAVLDAVARLPMRDSVLRPIIPASQLHTWANCEWAASIRDYLACETITGTGGWMDQVVLLDGSYIKDGHIRVSDKPGLGVELNPDVVKAHPAEGEHWWG